MSRPWGLARPLARQALRSRAGLGPRQRESGAPKRKAEVDSLARPVPLSERLIVFDTDWASDSIISEVAMVLASSRVKSTWFITHDSPAIRELVARPDLFEVGIHPYFSADSSHGETPREVVEFLLRIVPNARSVRTHDLMQSSSLLKMMREDYGLVHDASLLLPGAPHLAPHELYLSSERPLLRVPCFWEDDLEMSTPRRAFSMSEPRYAVSGLKVFAFHPIHVALNSRSPEGYLACKAALRLGDASVQDLTPYVNTESEGAGTFLRELIRVIQGSSCPSGATVAEIGAQWRVHGA